MEAKHTLTARSRAVIQVNYQGRSAEIAVTREQFEEMTADLLERTSYTSRQLLGVAGLEWKDVQRVLLVGGSTRMPMVARMLQGIYRHSARPHGQSRRGRRPRGRPVCRPSAGQARRGGATPSTFQVTNVNAHSLGVEGIDTDTLRKKNVVLIPRNTPLPARHTERFATKSEGQRSIVDQGPRRRKLAAGRLHRHRPHRGPRSARRAAQGLAGGSHLRVRHQRPADGRGPGAGHAASGPAGVGPRDGAFQRRPDALEAAGGRGGRIRDVRVGGPGCSAGCAAVPRGLAKWNRVGRSAGRPQRPTPPARRPPLRRRRLAASPAAAQRWLSGPQPLAGSIPLADPQSAAGAGSATPQASRPLAAGSRPIATPAPNVATTQAGHGRRKPVLPLIKRTKPEKKRRIPKWLERLIGHTIAAADRRLRRLPDDFAHPARFLPLALRSWQCSQRAEILRTRRHDRSQHSRRRHRPGHHVLRGRAARRARPAGDAGQCRGRSAHAQRRAVRRRRRGRGQGGAEGHGHRGRPRGRVRQARHGPSRLSQVRSKASSIRPR